MSFKKAQEFQGQLNEIHIISKVLDDLDSDFSEAQRTLKRLGDKIFAYKKILAASIVEEMK